MLLKIKYVQFYYENVAFTNNKLLKKPLRQVPHTPITYNEDLVMEQCKLLTKQFEFINQMASVSQVCTKCVNRFNLEYSIFFFFQNFDSEKAAIAVERKQFEKEKLENDKRVREKELVLEKQLEFIQDQTKKLNRQELIVEDMLKHAILTEIENDLKYQKPIKPFTHNIRLPEESATDESGSGKAKCVIPQLSRRNSCSGATRKKTQTPSLPLIIKEDTSEGTDTGNAEQGPLTIYEVIGGSKQQRRNTWNGARKFQANASSASHLTGRPERKGILTEFKCTNCNRWWTSASSFKGSQACQKCGTVTVPSTNVRALSGNDVCLFFVTLIIYSSFRVRQD